MTNSDQGLWKITPTRPRGAPGVPQSLQDRCPHMPSIGVEWEQKREQKKKKEKNARKKSGGPSRMAPPPVHHQAHPWAPLARASDKRQRHYKKGEGHRHKKKIRPPQNYLGMLALARRGGWDNTGNVLQHKETDPMVTKKDEKKNRTDFFFTEASRKKNQRVSFAYVSTCLLGARSRMEWVRRDT